MSAYNHRARVVAETEQTVGLDGVVTLRLPRPADRFDEENWEATAGRGRYELAADVLAQALAETRTEDGLEVLRNPARDWGSRLARDASVGTRHGLPLNRAAHALRVCGFEPRRTPDGEVVLRNCPFDSLRANSRELICGMNLALIEGLLAGLDLQGVHARLAPRAGMCCVALGNRPDEE